MKSSYDYEEEKGSTLVCTHGTNRIDFTIQIKNLDDMSPVFVESTIQNTKMIPETVGETQQKFEFNYVTAIDLDSDKIVYSIE